MNGASSLRLPRRITYALAAALLSLGAPVGLLAVRAAGSGGPAPGWIRRELAADWTTFVYVTVSTLCVFLLFGYVVGRQADRLAELAEADPLTRLRNARVLQERLEEEAARARRYGRPLSLLFIDVDGLKAVNDRGGHHAGDSALVRVAGALRQTARRTDLAARWGGDEFALLAPDTDAPAAARLGERVRALVSETAQARGEPMTVSVGVATTIAGRLPSASDLRTRADAALYQAKRQGRNRVVGAADGARHPA